MGTTADRQSIAKDPTGAKPSLDREDAAIALVTAWADVDTAKAHLAFAEGKAAAATAHAIDVLGAEDAATLTGIRATTLLHLAATTRTITLP
jgi:hypothetical protein